ncbi:hypothetical protein X759_25080 [Mesorhizobium sp. LSHC420B00]|nr:hypothetical protein X759_25080 [Mesorhizobium sp. LSHC420B00]
MKVRQMTMFVPIRRVPQSDAGTTRSSRITAIITSSGAAIIQLAARPVDAPGVDSARTRAKALTARAIVKTNLDRNRIVCMANAMSGRGPIVSQKTAAAITMAAPVASNQAAPSGSALLRTSASSALIRSSVLMLFPPRPEPFGNGGKPAV